MLLAGRGAGYPGGPRAQPGLTTCPAPPHPPRSDRPACELVEGGPLHADSHYPLLGALVHCNLRLGPNSLRRLLLFTDAALLRWAARHGRYDVLPQSGEAGAAGAVQLASKQSGGDKARGRKAAGGSAREEA